MMRPSALLLPLLATILPCVKAACFDTIIDLQQTIDEDFELVQNGTNAPRNNVYDLCQGGYDMTDPAIAAGPIEPKLTNTFIGCEQVSCVLEGIPTGFSEQVLIPIDSDIPSVNFDRLRFEPSGDGVGLRIGGAEDNEVNIVSCTFQGTSSTGSYVHMNGAADVNFVNGLADTMILQGAMSGSLLKNTGSGAMDVHIFRSNGPFSSDIAVFDNDGEGFINVRNMVIEGGTYDSIFLATDGMIKITEAMVSMASIGSYVVHADGAGTKIEAVYSGITPDPVNDPLALSIKECQTSGTADDSWIVIDVDDGATVEMGRVDISDNINVFRGIYATGSDTEFVAEWVTLMNNAPPSSVPADFATSTALIVAEDNAVATLDNAKAAGSSSPWSAFGIATTGGKLVIANDLCLQNYDSRYALFLGRNSTLELMDLESSYFFSGGTANCTQLFEQGLGLLDNCFAPGDGCSGTCLEDDSFVADFCGAVGGTAPPTASPSASPTITSMPTAPPTQAPSSSASRNYAGIVLAFAMAAVSCSVW